MMSPVGPTQAVERYAESFTPATSTPAADFLQAEENREP